MADQEERRLLQLIYATNFERARYVDVQTLPTEQLRTLAAELATRRTRLSIGRTLLYDKVVESRKCKAIVAQMCDLYHGETTRAVVDATLAACKRLRLRPAEFVAIRNKFNDDTIACSIVRWCAHAAVPLPPRYMKFGVVRNWYPVVVAAVNACADKTRLTHYGDYGFGSLQTVPYHRDLWSECFQDLAEDMDRMAAYLYVLWKRNNRLHRQGGDHAISNRVWSMLTNF